MNPTTPASAPTRATAHPVPDGFRSVTPHLVCASAIEAITFYQKAFGATESIRVTTPAGKLLHAALKIGDSIIMLNDEFPEMGAIGPKARGGSSVTIHLFVPDADAAFARAVEAGAQVVMPLENMFWGDRYGLLVDPFGHSWGIATHLRDLTLAEVQAAANTACA